MPYIALTIDDGPHPAYTGRLLDVLREEGVKATFFVVGKMARKYPELVRAVFESEHEIGNHTYTHPPLTTLMRHEVLEELQSTDEAVYPIIGRHLNLFRPPGGRYDDRILDIAAGEGYRTILWSVMTHDYASKDPVAIARCMMKGARAGSIILCHSGVEATIEALPGVIRALKQKGYQFVTVTEMLNIQLAHVSQQTKQVDYNKN